MCYCANLFLPSFIFFFYEKHTAPSIGSSHCNPAPPPAAPPSPSLPQVIGICVLGILRSSLGMNLELSHVGQSHRASYFTAGTPSDLWLCSLTFQLQCPESTITNLVHKSLPNQCALTPAPSTACELIANSLGLYSRTTESEPMFLNLRSSSLEHLYQEQIFHIFPRNQKCTTWLFIRLSQEQWL